MERSVLEDPGRFVAEPAGDDLELILRKGRDHEDRVIASLIDDGRTLLTDWEKRTGERLTRVGASVPGPADAVRGIVLNPPNLPSWHNAPIGAALREAFGVEVRIENDANAAALAEHASGAGRGVNDMVYLTMSTGVGAGVIADGRLLTGAFGGAGEVGHLPIAFPGIRCRCGLFGCLEAYVGGHAWRSRLREICGLLTSRAGRGVGR